MAYNGVRRKVFVSHYKGDVNAVGNFIDKWAYETEYRIITGNDYYDINGRIEAVLLGTRVQPRHADLLTKLIGDKYPVYSTKLNQQKVKIEKDKTLN
jgi:hypothetical protein